MKVKIISDKKTYVFETEQSSFVIGRSLDADLVVEDLELSRMHCQIIVEKKHIF